MHCSHWLLCHDCRLKHPVPAHQRLADAKADWREKHRGHRLAVKRVRPEWLDYAGNADVKQALQAEQTMTVTNLHSRGSSATQGWLSAGVDNTSNLYTDAEIMVHIAAVNTAPASDKNLYVFAMGSTDGTIYTSTGAGAAGAQTGTTGTEGSTAGNFPSISTLPIICPLIGTIAYPVQNVPLDGGPFYLTTAFKKLPPYWAIGILNFSGMTLAASGNTVKYRGMYDTVV